MAENNIFSYIKAGSSKLNASSLTNLFGTGTTPILTYPEGLGGSASSKGSSDIPFILFAPYVRKAASLNSIDYGKVLDNIPSPKFAIALPLTGSALKTEYGVSYDTTDLGVGGDIATGIKGVYDAFTKNSDEISGNSTGEKVNEAALAITKALQTTGVKSGYSAIQSALRIAGVDPNLFSKVTGVVVNPFTETVFTSVKTRNHSFDYTFMPKSLEESKRIDDILQIFKFYMLPASGSPFGSTSSELIQGSFFSFPYEFQITYSVSDTTFTLLPSVLDRLSINYGGGNDSPAFFMASDGKKYPTKINVSMNFQEIMFLTRDRLEVTNSEFLNSDTEAVPKDKVTGQPLFTRYRF